MSRKPAKVRDKAGRFEETWMFQESPSAGRPAEKVFLPPNWGRWKYRWYVKRGRMHFFADGGTLGKHRLRVWGDTIEKVVEKSHRMEARIREHGQWARKLNTAQLWQAAENVQICEKLGVQPIDVVREFEKTHPHGANARTLDEIRIEVVAAKKKSGRSERHLVSLDYRLRSLVEAIGNKRITAITTEELQDELDRHPNWSPTTIHSVTQGWKIAFNFAIRRGYALTNPANKLELPPIVREAPQVLTVDQAKRLLAATLFSDRNPLLPQCRAWLAIGMFAGLRPDEIGRLDWKHVDLAAGVIRVMAGSAKDRELRYVDISPNLRTWLAPIAKSQGKVLRCGLDAARVAARGILGLAQWPQDVLRHTFASYHFALHRNEAETKHQMGHRDDGRIFYNHYCVPVAPAEAKKFWGTVQPVAFLASAA